MDIIHHSLPINFETIGSTHRASIQNFQKSSKMKNETIIVVINKKQRFELIYLKKLLLVILIVIELMFQTSY